jgi:hypothetical protein
VSVRPTLSLLACLSLAVCLSACGGDSSTSTASSATPGGSTAATGPTEATGPAGGSASGGSGGSRETGSSGAAAFIVPQGDNSIPEYGSEASGFQQAEATAALRVYLEARANGDWSTACANMGASARGQVEVLAEASKDKAKGCEEAFAALSAYGPVAERANPLVGGLAAFRVKGEKAFALFYGPHDQKYMIPMVSEGGTWKVNQIAPVPYPPGAPTTGG